MNVLILNGEMVTVGEQVEVELYCPCAGKNYTPVGGCAHPGQCHCSPQTRRSVERRREEGRLDSTA